MFRTVRITGFILTLTLALSGLALAQDDDDHYRQGNQQQAGEYGYDHGYRDGLSRGQHEGREHDPHDYQTPDWRQATRGYQRWMGPVEFYQRAYQKGYREGFRSGFESAEGSWLQRDGDRSSDGYRGDGWQGGYHPGGRDVAARWGYQDGMDAARGDLARGKPYNSTPRGKYDDRDRGYRREFGSKDDYKSEYTEAYRQGYDDAMNGRY
jgi:hypothetical protein